MFKKIYMLILVTIAFSLNTMAQTVEKADLESKAPETNEESQVIIDRITTPDKPNDYLVTNFDAFEYKCTVPKIMSLNHEPYNYFYIDLNFKEDKQDQESIRVANQFSEVTINVLKENFDVDVLGEELNVMETPNEISLDKDSTGIVDELIYKTISTGEIYSGETELSETNRIVLIDDFNSEDSLNREVLSVIQMFITYDDENKPDVYAVLKGICEKNN